MGTSFWDNGPLLGFGGAIIGALIVALAPILWTAVTQKKSKISVSVVPHKFILPRFLADGIYEHVWNYHINIKPTAKNKEMLLFTRRVRGLVTVYIKNRSKRTIHGLTVNVAGNEEFIADIERNGDFEKTLFLKMLRIGDIYPESTIKINIWCTTNFTRRYADIKNSIVVRASEYDSITINSIPTEYIGANYFQVPKTFIFSVCYLFFIIVTIISIIGYING